MNKKKSDFPEEEPSAIDKLIESRFFVWVASNTRRAAGVAVSVIVA